MSAVRAFRPQQIQVRYIMRGSAGKVKNFFIFLHLVFDILTKIPYNKQRTTTKWENTMLLGLSKIMDCPGGVIPFEMALDLRQETFGGCQPVREPVLCRGQVRNTAGVLVLTGTLETRLHGVCDRCAAEFQRDVSLPVEAVLVRELANEEEADTWTFLLDGNDADLDEIMTTAFVLSMDTKLLCREDCKGLCPTCGKNLNEGPCDCKPEGDPRFAALKQLLK